MKYDFQNVFPPFVATEWSSWDYKEQHFVVFVILKLILTRVFEREVYVKYNVQVGWNWRLLSVLFLKEST